MNSAMNMESNQVINRNGWKLARASGAITFDDMAIPALDRQERATLAGLISGAKLKPKQLEICQQILLKLEAHPNFKHLPAKVKAWGYEIFPDSNAAPTSDPEPDATPSNSGEKPPAKPSLKVKPREPALERPSPRSTVLVPKYMAGAPRSVETYLAEAGKTAKHTESGDVVDLYKLFHNTRAAMLKDLPPRYTGNNHQKPFDFKGDDKTWYFGVAIHLSSNTSQAEAVQIGMILEGLCHDDAARPVRLEQISDIEFDQDTKKYKVLGAVSTTMTVEDAITLYERDNAEISFAETGQALVELRNERSRKLYAAANPERKAFGLGKDDRRAFILQMSRYSIHRHIETTLSDQGHGEVLLYGEPMQDVKRALIERQEAQGAHKSMTGSSMDLF